MLALLLPLKRLVSPLCLDCVYHLWYSTVPWCISVMSVTVEGTEEVMLLQNCVAILVLYAMLWHHRNYRMFSLSKMEVPIFKKENSNGVESVIVHDILLGSWYLCTFLHYSIKYSTAVSI